MKKTIIFFVVFVLTINTVKAGYFGGGSGTESDPYLITTPRQMDSVRYYQSACFKLMADLDLTTVYSSWVPITKSGAWFTGTFDGNNHIIKYKISSYSGDYSGLFSVNDGGTIKNLGVIANISNVGAYTGGLVGFNRGTITSCFSTGKVASLSSTVGGLVGRNSKMINNCYSSANVKGTMYLGGFVGENDDSPYPLINCYSTGWVVTIGDSPYSNGGFVGYNYNYDNTSKIKHCYSTGYVSAKTTSLIFPGGFAGTHGYSYNTSADSAAVIDDCYYNVETSCQSKGIGYIGNSSVVKNVYGYNTNAMQQDTTFEEFDFTNSWQMINGETYPALLNVFNNAPFAFGERIIGVDTIWLSDLYKNDYDFETGQTNLVFKVLNKNGAIDTLEYYIFPSTSGPSFADTIVYQVGELVSLSYGTDTLWGNKSLAIVAKSPFEGGRGTLTDPYLIKTTTQMDSVRNYPDASFKLLNDLDLSAVTSNWKPIGIDKPFFTGTFDGDFKTIKYSIELNNPNQVNTGANGLFSINSGTIKNLNVNATIKDTISSLYGRNGGIAGMNIGGNIISCSVSGFVSGNLYTGGITGTNSGVIKYSYNTADVWGRTAVGGFAAVNFSHGIISHCYSSGHVSTPSSVGGFVGSNIDTATIINSYTTGIVENSNLYDHLAPTDITYIEATYSTGGFAQTNGLNATISNSYSSGQVSAVLKSGGFLGTNNGTVLTSYYNKTTSLQDSAVGYNYGITPNIPGLTIIQLRDSANIKIPAFDFVLTWRYIQGKAYPGLDSVNNAPFAFRDTLNGTNSIDLSNVLLNDYDIETAKSKLTYKVQKIYGAGTLNNGVFVANGIDSVLYRVGEVLSTTDTLWGNEAVAILYVNVLLNASVDSLQLGAVSNNTYAVDINSNVSWNISTDANWLSLSKVSGTGNSTLEISAATNSNQTSRIAHVFISSEGNYSDTIIVVQYAVTHLSALVQIFNKNYDGTTTANASLLNIGNVNQIDTVSASIIEANFDTKNSGINKTVNIKLSYTGPQISNYTFDTIIIVYNAEITPIQLSISDPVLNTSKVYDGNTSANVTAGTLSGIVSDEEVLVTATAYYDNKNVGSGKTITVTYALSGNDTANYLKPTDYIDNSGLIEKQPQTIEWEQTFSDIKTGSEPVNLTAYSNKELPISYSSSDINVLSIDNNNLIIIGVGPADITAHQDGNDTIAPATNVVKSIVVSQGLDISDFTSSFSIYPNPSNGKVYIESTETILTGVDVFDLSGLDWYTIKNQAAFNKITLDLSHLKTGTYILKVETKRGTEIRKIIIRK
jgi:hypothetical protein